MRPTGAVGIRGTDWFVSASLNVLVLILALSAQSLSQQPESAHTGVPMDWSTRHVLFTNHGSVEDRATAMRDPRFYIHWLQRTGRVVLPRTSNRPSLPHKTMRVDWAMSLGPTGGMPVGESPAKYGFNDSGYSCANDFVVYTIGATPGSGQANLVAFNNLYTGAASSSC